MKKEQIGRWAGAAAFAAVGGALVASAAVLYSYMINMPMPTELRWDPDTTEPCDQADWMKYDAVVSPDGGYVIRTAANPMAVAGKDGQTGSGYSLAFGVIGATYASANASYNIGDVILPPNGNVDWSATYAQYSAENDTEEKNLTSGFLFIIDGDNSSVRATCGGTFGIDWVMKDGTTVTVNYVIAPFSNSRPRRIYWTDYPYNGQMVDLSGKFVKFFGKASLVAPPRVTTTNDVGGVQVVEEDKIVSGLYLNTSSMTLEARGEEQGQVLMVYYRDGNYDDIQLIQTIEVCRPDTIVRDGLIGTPVTPDGRGYDIDGLKAVVQAGIGDVKDGRGDYLYQHEGEHSYSEHTGDVYPIRPTRGQPWKAEVCWMEEDPMKVYWPFEIDQYESDWPTDTIPYVRGDLGGDSGKAITIPSDYSATLMTYQEPEGHARDVEADGTFITDLQNSSTNIGFALVKLTANDKLWFATVKSVLRSNTDYFTLEPQDARVGQPLLPDGVGRSAVATKITLPVSVEAGPYVYAAGTPALNYDANLYAETNSASVVYPISDDGVIEVWWSARVQRDGMPVAIDVPSLPAVYSPSWPGTNEAPQIVLASQLGSAYETLYGHYGAATFDSACSSLTMPERTYFPNGEGTFALWTRLRDFEDLSVTNGTQSFLILQEADISKTVSNLRNIGLKLTRDQQMVLTQGTNEVTRGDFADAVSDVWMHFALTVSNKADSVSEIAVSIDGRQILRGELTDGYGDFLAGTIKPALGFTTELTAEAPSVPQPEAFVAKAGALDCATWEDFTNALRLGKSVRLTSELSSAGKPVILPEGTDVTLDLNGFAINGRAGEYLFKIIQKATLVLGDSSADASGMIALNGGMCAYLAGGGTFDIRGAKISGGAGEYGAGFKIDNGGALKLHSGTISGCNASIGGGAVYIASYGSFTMNGGTIENCTAPDTLVSSPDGGGAVLLRYGTFTMNGGTISGCRSRTGGGVHVVPGRMIMNGGTITKCESDVGGGGVMLERWWYGDNLKYDVTAELEMNGGFITGNDGGSCGGGVYMWDGVCKFAMNGGEISGNVADSYPCVGAMSGQSNYITLSGGTLDVEPTIANFGGIFTEPDYRYDAGTELYYIGLGTTVGRQIAEVIAYDRSLSAEELAVEKYKVREGVEAGITGYWSFRPNEDLVTTGLTLGTDTRAFLDRTEEGKPEVAGGAKNVILSLPGAPLKSSTVIVPDSGNEPTIYRQNDDSLAGYNPNEEHAFVQSGNGGYVVWALRCDLGLGGARQGVFAEYVKNGKSMLQYYHVLATDAQYPAFAGTCTAGLALPGPKPLTVMSEPWLANDYWKGDTDGVYRDRKKQLWCRRGGANFDVYMYYRNQASFDWPTMTTPPSVGDAVPWLSLLDEPTGQQTPNKFAPKAWNWTSVWPENVPTMKVGQTLTVAENNLPEVWNARSMAVVYPAPTEGTNVVMLTDPTVARQAELEADDFTELGLSADPNGGLTLRKGIYRFTEASPFISERLYYDPSNEQLCFTGEREEKSAGVTVLYPNVLSVDERKQVLNLVKETAEDWEYWEEAVTGLALDPVQANFTEFAERKVGVEEAKVSELVTTYRAVDHYALTALGGYNYANSTALGSTNYVVIIENDASEDTMAYADEDEEDDEDEDEDDDDDDDDDDEDDERERQACPVADGDAISMHVIKIVPEYYLGRVITREDSNNLLSQQLTVLYTESFGGNADDFIFEWGSHKPNADGSVPKPREVAFETRKPMTEYGEPEDGSGQTRFVVGHEGDMLKNMVNTYWACRYRAKEGTMAATVMGTNWSAWVEEPGLAEGWLQRCLNNITPFNQRMTDLYDNEAETAVTMIQQAGKPFTGDVALNQDNLTSVGLIELYETLLDKAESMSLLLKDNDDGANQQLLLAVERLHDLYKILGDEAYSDAKNPAISFGLRVEKKAVIDYESELTSLFCFDNQVSSLLDEEICLLRGRSGKSAPTTHFGPYYNRLVWNFTKGITAGEVAYAVNYAVDGIDDDTATMTEEQAAKLYPQGHGDAYGHYLSALKGWYRLLRNPYFSWGSAKQGEMNVADAAINVDYYEEAKFAQAAADLAKTAADVVDLTARAAWRDAGSGVTSAGYLDSNTTNAFGYGEWASRGGYGALCNWVVANSLLPMDRTLETGLSEDYEDLGLTRIDRGNTEELQEICDSAAAIVRMVDRIDCGQNPLGLSDRAIPFDITPDGVADGSNSHFEQVRDRAATALDNARKLLERAQVQSGRMQILQGTAENFAQEYQEEEEDFEEELMEYFGSPYSDDIGPGKTYEQGYEGPDLYHYMWMDFSSFGISDDDLDDLDFEALTITEADIISEDSFDDIREYMSERELDDYDDDEDYDDDDAFDIEANAEQLDIVCKPKSITGYRTHPGAIQEALGDVLVSYYAAEKAEDDMEAAWDNWETLLKHYESRGKSEYDMFAANESLVAAEMAASAEVTYLKAIAKQKDLASKIADAVRATAENAAPSVVGAGLTVITSPRSIVQAVLSATATDKGIREILEGEAIVIQGLMDEWEYGVELAELAYDYESDKWDLYEDLKDAALEVAESYEDYKETLVDLNTAIDACRTTVAEGFNILERRLTARRRQVNQLTKLRYNEMFFRKLRDKTLTKYSSAFDIAQKYVFMAAQVYDYETGLGNANGSEDSFKAKIVATRSLGAFDSDSQPIVADDGDLGLSGYLAQMNANWLVLKPRLGINNPQQYTTWFSLRHELFRIYSDESGDQNWAAELKKYWVEDITKNSVYQRYCQKFQSQYGLQDKEPGFVIPFSTTIDFAKNLFGRDLASANDHAYDSTWYSTRIAAAGVWFDGYNEKTADAAKSAQGQLAANPTVYLLPVGSDCLRAPGQEDGRFWKFPVVDQVIAAPYSISSYELDDETWYPSMEDADWDGGDPTVKIRRHPMFRAYYGEEGALPDDDRLDATRLIGRSVWNTQWYLIIPAGAMNADREKAMAAFLNGYDTNRDGKADIKPVTDIKIGFRTYSQSGN